MSADIDIDVPNRNELLSFLKHTPARQVVNGTVRKHNSGIYVTNIPYDVLNECASIEYEEAERRGYFKIDLLNMSVYQLINSPEEYNLLLKETPPWRRLWEDPSWAKQLVHVGNYTELLATMKPDSIPRMAAFISVIRPGKAHLQGKPWQEVFKTVWDGDDSKGFIFKKSHSLSYAMLVTLHMNILNRSFEQV